MPIEFVCSNCQKTLRTPDEAAGKKARCPQCSHIMDVPHSSSVPTPPLPSATLVSPPSKPTGNPFADAGSAPPAFGPPPSRPAALDMNPYAAPAGNVGFQDPTAQSKGELSRGKVDFEKCLSHSWDLFNRFMGPCILAGLAVVAVNIGVSVFLGQIIQFAAMGIAQQADAPALVFLGQAINQLIGWLLNTWFTIGMYIFGIKMFRNGRGQVSDLFAAGPYYLRALLASVLKGLAYLGLAVFVAIPALIVANVQGFDQVQRDPSTVVGVAIVAGLIVVPFQVWLTFSWLISVAFIVDRNAGARESLSLSYQYMSGNRLVSFLIILVVGFAVGILTLCTCGIGALFGGPYIWLISAAIYLQATGQPTSSIAPRGLPEKIVLPPMN